MAGKPSREPAAAGAGGLPGFLREDWAIHISASSFKEKIMRIKRTKRVCLMNDGL
ncbi:hypothetical protein PPH41_17095 [Burkholderia gladioli]|nr:hypothetical protein [Burkholderia gladioli]